MEDLVIQKEGETVDPNKIPFYSLVIAVLSMAGSFYFTWYNVKRQKEKEKKAETVLQTQLLAKVETLASKNYIDQKLSLEMNGLREDFNEKIDELKQDIKSQKDLTNEMRTSVIQTSESTKYAHERITELSNRLSDIVNLSKKS